jgi:cell wall-associated NlpC family hydrolase
MKMETSVPVAPLRREANDRSEIVSQALMGEPITIIDRQEKWSLVRLETDGYEGWMDNKQFTSSENVESRFMLTAPVSRCLNPIRERVFLPAGSWVSVSYVVEDEQPTWNADAHGLRECAFQFLNAPYLWGGRTIMGIDCSGFSQLVFKLNGLSLPRDAYQQAELGATVSFVEEAVTGDLAFFDNSEGRIVHVGIVLRETNDVLQIIHASGKVRVDMLDHEGIYSKEHSIYTHKLRIIKRITR